jgi:integrase
MTSGTNMHRSWSIAAERLYEVQQILGHSDPKVTMRYSHLSSKALQAAANSASIIIRGAAKASALQPAEVAAG